MSSNRLVLFCLFKSFWEKGRFGGGEPVFQNGFSPSIIYPSYLELLLIGKSFSCSVGGVQELVSLVRVGLAKECIVESLDLRIVMALYEKFLGEPNSHKAHELLHTTYAAREAFRD